MQPPNDNQANPPVQILMDQQYTQIPEVHMDSEWIFFRNVILDNEMQMLTNGNIIKEEEA